MALLVECPDCREINSLLNHACRRCGSDLPRGAKRIYWVQWTDIRKKRRLKRVGLTTEKVAGRVLKRRQEAVRKEKNDSLFSRVTFVDLAEAYVLKLEARKSTSVKDAKLFFQRMISFWGGKTFVRHLTPEMVHRFQLYLRRKGHTRAYCDKHLAMGRAAWNTLFRDRPNPFSKVELFQYDNRVVNLLSPEEEQRLFSVAFERYPRLWQIMVVSVGTGLRQGMVRTLKWRQVDFNRGIIRVHRKGREWHEVPMSSVVRWVLNRMVRMNSPYLWPSPKRLDKPIGSVRKSWQRCKELAGITKPLRLQDLRHWTAMKILNATSNLKTVKETLGHSDLLTTTRLYERFLATDVKSAVECVAASTPMAGMREETEQARE